MNRLLNGLPPPVDTKDDDIEEIINLLKTYYLFEKDSKDHALAKAMMNKAGLEGLSGLFSLLVRLDVFDENENIDLLRFEIATEFSDEVLNAASNLALSVEDFSGDEMRTDLTALPLMTIDGQSTLDFDDALSIEKVGDRFRLGIHIVDVGQYRDPDAPQPDLVLQQHAGSDGRGQRDRPGHGAVPVGDAEVHHDGGDAFLALAGPGLG